jgi:hypothetical protein
MNSVRGFQAFGLLGIFSPLQPLIDALPILQAVRSVAASIAVGWQAGRASLRAPETVSDALGLQA